MEAGEIKIFGTLPTIMEGEASENYTHKHKYKYTYKSVLHVYILHGYQYICTYTNTFCTDTNTFGHIHKCFHTYKYKCTYTYNNTRIHYK